MADGTNSLLDAPRVPSDAGEYGEALSRLLARIPEKWGRFIGVGRGWYPLVTELDTAISAVDPDYEIHQVKEKFGTLRYYCTGDGEDSIRTLIKEAEARSSVTCEKCGAPGRHGVSEGWWRTTCSEHAPEYFVVDEPEAVLVDVRAEAVLHAE